MTARETVTRQGGDASAAPGAKRVGLGPQGAPGTRDATPSPEDRAIRERARGLLWEHCGAPSNGLVGASDAFTAVLAALTPSQPDTSAGEGLALAIRALRRISALTPFHANADTADDLHASVKAIAESALASLSTPSAGEGLVLVPRGDLAERCDEILSWRKTGIYEGTALQELADTLADSVGLPSIRAAEDRTVLDALELVAAAPANPSLRGTGEEWPADAEFQLGDRVTTKRKPFWIGTLCGFYRNSDARLGYCVESEAVPGAIHVYPAHALEVAALRPTNGSTEA